ncbi:MAG: hypothetical protein MPW15_02115 [Candidatus Manganitrophus sp.]|nr:hypothetical protein [Candidatus Manganitrophus sp.]
MNRLLDRFDHFLIDLDGVVYLGDQPTLCAAETFTALNDAGKRRLFITNDPRHTAQGYATKLARLGIPADPAEFLTSGRAAALYLQREPEKPAGRFSSSEAMGSAQRSRRSGDMS